MDTTNVNNLDGQNRVRYALVISHIVLLLVYLVNAILSTAPLLNFWLPVFALVAFYGYSAIDEYKKLNDRAVVRERSSLKTGFVTLVLLIFLLATKYWKTSPLGIGDAIIWALLLGNNKDYLLDVLATRKFSRMSAEK